MIGKHSANFEYPVRYYLSNYGASGKSPWWGSRITAIPPLSSQQHRSRGGLHPLWIRWEVHLPPQACCPSPWLNRHKWQNKSVVFLPPPLGGTAVSGQSTSQCGAGTPIAWDPPGTKYCFLKNPKAFFLFTCICSCANGYWKCERKRCNWLIAVVDAFQSAHSDFYAVHPFSSAKGHHFSRKAQQLKVSTLTFLLHQHYFLGKYFLLLTEQKTGCWEMCVNNEQFCQSHSSQRQYPSQHNIRMLFAVLTNGYSKDMFYKRADTRNKK